MINLNGVTNIKIEEVNYISNMEPRETYFRASITKMGIEGKGLGETEKEALIDAMDWIESYNLETERIAKGIETEFPF